MGSGGSKSSDPPKAPPVNDGKEITKKKTAVNIMEVLEPEIQGNSAGKSHQDVALVPPEDISAPVPSEDIAVSPSTSYLHVGNASAEIAEEELPQSNGAQLIERSPPSSHVLAPRPPSSTPLSKSSPKCGNNSAKKSPLGKAQPTSLHFVSSDEARLKRVNEFLSVHIAEVQTSIDKLQAGKDLGISSMPPTTESFNRLGVVSWEGSLRRQHQVQKSERNHLQLLLSQQTPEFVAELQSTCKQREHELDTVTAVNKALRLQDKTSLKFILNADSLRSLPENFRVTFEEELRRMNVLLERQEFEANRAKKSLEFITTEFDKLSALEQPPSEEVKEVDRLTKNLQNLTETEISFRRTREHLMRILSGEEQKRERTMARHTMEIQQLERQIAKVKVEIGRKEMIINKNLKLLADYLASSSVAKLRARVKPAPAQVKMNENRSEGSPKRDHDNEAATRFQDWMREVHHRARILTQKKKALMEALDKGEVQENEDAILKDTSNLPSLNDAGGHEGEGQTHEVHTSERQNSRLFIQEQIFSRFDEMENEERTLRVNEISTKKEEKYNEAATRIEAWVRGVHQRVRTMRKKKALMESWEKMEAQLNDERRTSNEPMLQAEEEGQTHEFHSNEEGDKTYKEQGLISYLEQEVEEELSFLTQGSVCEVNTPCCPDPAQQIGIDIIPTPVAAKSKPAERAESNVASNLEVVALAPTEAAKPVEGPTEETLKTVEGAQLPKNGRRSPVQKRTKSSGLGEGVSSEDLKSCIAGLLEEMARVRRHLQSLEHSVDPTALAEEYELLLADVLNSHTKIPFSSLNREGANIPELATLPIVRLLLSDHHGLRVKDPGIRAAMSDVLQRCLEKVTGLPPGEVGDDMRYELLEALLGDTVGLVDHTALGSDGLSVLARCAKVGDRRGMRMLLDLHPETDLHRVLPDGTTAAMVAAHYGQEAFLEEFLGFSGVSVDSAHRKTQNRKASAL